MAFDKSKVLKSAEKFVAAGKIPQAIDEYQKILKENPKDWNLMIQIGDLMLKISKSAEAIEYFQKVADHYYSDGFFLKAIAIYKRINKLDPNLTDICIKLSDLYLKQGLTMDAKSQLQIVAHHYLSKNQNKEAIQTLQKLVEIEPDNLRTRNELAKTYKTENMVPEAVQEYMEISDQLTRKNLLKESIAVLETAYKLDQRNTEILQKILNAYTEQNEAEKGVALIEEALKSDPANAGLLALLAESYQEKNEFQKAHDVIDRAIGNALQKEQLWELKGNIYLKSGEVEKAFSQYAQVVEKEIQRKDIDNSINLLEKIIHADASFYAAWRKLVDIYTMLRQNANLMVAYGNLADAYITKKMYKEAEAPLEKLISLDPEDSQHQEKLKFVRSFFEKPEPKKPVKEYEVEAEVTPRTGVQNISAGRTPGVPAFERAPAAAHTVSQPAKAPPRPAPQQAVAKAAPVAAAPSSVEEEKAFVSEHMIEAEVFNKYGLIDKAIEQLQLIVSKYPSSTAARQKLKEIYLEKGDRDRAADECIKMSRIFKDQGDSDLVEDLLSEAREISPNHPAVEKAYRELSLQTKELPAAKLAPAPEPVKPAPVIAKQVKEKPPAAKVSTSSTIPQVSSLKTTSGITKMKDLPKSDVLGEIEKLAHKIKTQSGTFKVKPVPPPPAATSKSPPPQPPQRPPVLEEMPDIEIEIEEPVPEIKTPASKPSLAREFFEEFDFFIEQGLHGEAEKILENLRQKHPDDPGVLERVAKIKEKVVAPPTKIEQPVAASAEEEISIDFDEELLRSSEVRANVNESEVPEIAIPIDEMIIDVGVDSNPAAQEKNEFAAEEPSAEEQQKEEPVDIGLLTVKIEDAGEPLIPVVTEGTTLGENATEIRFTEFAELDDSSATEQRISQNEDDISLEQSLNDAVDAVFQVKEEPPGAMTATAEPEQEETKTAHVKEELFEEEDDFFDLAAELEEGLLNVQSAVEDERPPDGQNYSIEEILTDFKKGVEKQLSTEDYDTRYNLGIAYKEMGLIDEAIAEFQIAAKDPKRFLECCSMLGLCFVEKGMHKLAIKWYQRGLDTPGYSDEEYQGVRFELAQAYEALGEVQKAVEVYQDVYGINANYRNVSKKMKELQELLKKK